MKNEPHILSVLTEREKEVFLLRFGLNGNNLSYDDVGRRMKKEVTRERVRQIMAKAIEKIRQAFPEENITRFYLEVTKNTKKQSIWTT